MPVNKEIVIKSKYLNSDVPVGIVLPEKIDKVLLLLHGYNGTYKILQNNLPLSEYASSHNTLIVTPNMSNGYYIDKEDYSVSEFIKSELLEYVFKSFGLPPVVERYIAGISMGGYGSLLIGSKYPTEFCKIISISGAFIAHDVAIGNPQVVGLPNDNETLEYFTKTFAPFDTLENDPARNPIAAIIKSNEENDLPKIILTCGTEDPLFERNVDAIQTLDKHGIEYEWFPIEGGVHDDECFWEGMKVL